MAFLESIARQAAIKLATGQISPEQAASVTAFNLGERGIIKAETVPLEQIIAEERAYQESKSNDPLNRVGAALKPIVSAGLTAVAGLVPGGSKLVSAITEPGRSVTSPALTVSELDQLAQVAPLIPTFSRSNPVMDDIVIPSLPSFDLPSFDLGSVVNAATRLYQIKQQEDAQRVMMTQAAFPAIPGLSSLLGGATRLGTAMIPAVGGAVVRAGRGFITAAGRMISRKKAVALAKQLGVQGAATALGIGALELAEAVVSESQRARRGKSITAASMRTTRRTMRQINSLHRQLAGFCRETGVGRSRRAAPAPKRCR